MRFEFYHAGLDETRKLSVDGTVPNSLHFSHWQGNRTHASLKADTSTEIALNLVGSPLREELTEGIRLVTNNHFDTDGVLSVWTLLEGERALGLREKLVAAAEAGDFSAYSTADGVRASIVIQGSEQAGPDEPDGSPLARYLAGEEVTDEARSYELVLPEVERVITRTDDYEPLWREGWRSLAAALESFERGESRVTEDVSTGLSLITLAPRVYGQDGFDPVRHRPSLTAITAHARGRVYLIATPLGQGWSYRVDYPYYSWAETVTRPLLTRRDFKAVVSRLNALEMDAHEGWRLDASELSSAFKYVDETGTQGASSLAPEIVAEELSAALR
jgi:hypothetical protein